MIAKKLRPITRKEWIEYEWVDVSSVGCEEFVYIRTVKNTLPPDDEFVYREATKMGDAERKWKRIMTYDD